MRDNTRTNEFGIIHVCMMVRFVPRTNDYSLHCVKELRVMLEYQVVDE